MSPVQYISFMVLFLVFSLTAASASGAAEDHSTLVIKAKVIELHQTACQFVEPEGGDQKFSASSFDACEALNEKSGNGRLSKAAALKLAPGAYTFRVYNDDVPYILGFWLRGSGLGRFTLSSVFGGGIEAGKFREYNIDLRAGEYRYSCPLNPTPAYILLVE